MTQQIQKPDARFIHKPAGTHGGLTLGYVRRENSVIVGVSRCHPTDTYSRKGGANLALDRLNALLAYGANSTVGPISVLRNAENGQIVALEIKNPIVSGAAAAGVLGASKATFNAIDAVYLQERADTIVTTLASIFEKIPAKDVTHHAMDLIVVSITDSALSR